jgi:DNA uptake protein ComE-like DNA-binding protein
MRGRIARAAGLFLLAGLTGCVGQGIYDQTLRELQSAKSDLERIRIQNEGLNKQVSGLKESNGKLKEDIEKANAQIASLNEAVVKERQAGEGKLKDLERQVKELTASKKALSQELEVAKQRYEDSLRIQKRQAKELKERERAALLQPPTPSPKPVVPAPPASPSAPESPSAMPDQAANGSSSATPKPPSNLVDINKATPSELSVTLELPKEDAEKLVKNRPYKTKEELVTKAGIAKTTVDKIKDKVTIGP